MMENKKNILANNKTILVVMFGLVTMAVFLGRNYIQAQESASEPDTCATCPAESGAADEHADEHAGESAAEHAHESVITLTEASIELFGIKVEHAGSGKIDIATVLPAEITVNGDKTAHVIPHISGAVVAVNKTVGDKVQAGEVLAVLHSRELSDLKTDYLAALEISALAESVYEREKSLWEKKITAEQDYLQAKGEAAKAKIALRSASQKLQALGFSQEYLRQLPQQPEESFIVYEITAPIAGTVIQKHITLGEILKDDSLPYVIADLSEVWVNMSISPRELARVMPGLNANVKTEYAQGRGVVSYVGQVADENTRTAQARVVLSNEPAKWHPGTFATTEICLDEYEGKVVVPADAIITVNGENLIFVPEEGGFKAVEVEPGMTNAKFTEIIAGLEPGQEYVAQGAFTLKSELTKSTGDPCGGH